MILRPCPFCGFRDEARLGREDPAPGLRVLSDPAYLRERSWWVECDNCGSRGPHAQDVNEARAEWNKRDLKMPHPDDELDDLESPK